MILSPFFKILVPLIVLVLLWLLTGYGNLFGVPAPLSYLPTRQNVLALTFDDGPSPYTPSILKLLGKTGTRATFFVLGQNARRYPLVIRWMAREGHDVENHTWSHPHLFFHRSGFIRAEIEETSALIERLTGRKPLFFRPPYGQVHSGILGIVNQLGLSTVLWTVTGYDWLSPGAERIRGNVLGGLKPGAIVLLHDGGGNRRQTAEALPAIIAQAEALGFRFVTLRDLKP